jgi:hypothetical protein
MVPLNIVEYGILICFYYKENGYAAQNVKTAIAKWTACGYG